MAEYTGKDLRRWNDVTANKTLVVDTDAGVVQNVTADAKTVTLPAAVLGAQFIVRNAGAAPSGAPAGTGSDGTVLLTIAPNGTDTIGGGGRAAANSNLVNTKATHKVGDFVVLSAISGGWKIVEKSGIWA